MTGGQFSIHTTPGFDRSLEALARHHPDLIERVEEALRILQSDPYNSTQRHKITKLTGVKPGQGQYRLRLSRWRFRYDIAGRTVDLVYCGLRREDTY